MIRLLHRTPKFSIITICFNDAVGLASTIRSVGNQTHRDYQYIVQDGGSSDETPEIVRGFRDWVDVYNSQADHGIYDAMNRAVESATGEFTIFMNAADLFAENDTLEKIANELREGDEIVHGAAIQLETGHNHVHKPLNDYAFGMVFDHQAVVARTGLLRQFPFDSGLKVSGDLDFLARCRINDVRFRPINVSIPRKPYFVGASSDYLDRFRERAPILMKYFSQEYPDIKHRLKNELLEYVEEKFGSSSLSERFSSLKISQIVEEIDVINNRLQSVIA